VIEVSTGVYVAIGYGLANCIMIEGNDGVIIGMYAVIDCVFFRFVALDAYSFLLPLNFAAVDCMECPQTAEDVAEAFRKICTKPVVAIIYTHNHQDHTGGAKAFMKYAKDRKCDIYAHRLTSEIISKFVSKTGTIAFIRGARQFGQYLSNKQHINSGIGPCLTFDENTAFDVQLPTITFDSELVVTISGVLLKLIHVPGETDDQICVYLPQKSLLCPADNIYKAFPNLYAIRGTPTRDALEWAHSLDIMKNLMADILVPSHTRPLHGRDTIAETFDAYRDGILFVHDQTVRLMNKGYFIDDIVCYIAKRIGYSLWCIV
jgi:alkyl sulfatase BDS1-like metallo-beta-lactamase superfamily hydrolase